MNGSEYEKTIEALGLSKAEAAVFMDITDRSSRTYCRKGAPTVVAKLLSLMRAKGISVEEVNEIMQAKKRRKS